MFSKNERISAKQLKRLIVIDLFSVIVIIAPRIAVSILGKDGGVGIILASVYALIFAWIIMILSKDVKGSYIGYIKESVGSFLAYIIGLIYIIKIIFTGGLLVRLFGEVIKATLLKDTDLPIIILIVLLVAGYMASKGFEIRARVAEIIYLFILIPILLLLLFGFENIEISNLMPLFQANIVEIASGSYSIFLIFSLLDLLLFAVPMVRLNHDLDSSKGSKKVRSIYSYVAGGILIVSVFSLMIFLTALGILGPQEVSRKLWSSITTLQMIELPGGTIQRYDGLIMGIWTLSTFSVVSGFLYYFSHIGKEILCVSDSRYLMIPAIIVCFGVAIIPVDIEEMFEYYRFFMYAIGIPLSLILPMGIMVIHKYRSKWKKSHVKNFFLPFVVFCALSTLTGCRDMTEIEDRNFIQVIGLDSIKGEQTLSFLLPDLLTLTGQDSQEQEKLAVEITGENFHEIEEQFALQSSKMMDFSHLKAILINKDILNDSEILEKFLEYIKEKNEISRNTPVFLCSSKISEIFSLNGVLNGGIGDYLDQIYHVNLLEKGKKKITLSDLMLAMDNPNRTTYLPILEIDGEVLKVMGIGVLSHNQLVYEISKNRVSYFFISQGYGENSRLYLENKESERVSSVKLLSIKRDITFRWLNEKPYIEFSFKGKGDNDLAYLEEEIVNEQIKEEITMLFEEIVKDRKIDFINLYSMTSYKNRGMWFQYQLSLAKFLEELEYEIKVDIKLN